MKSINLSKLKSLVVSGGLVGAMCVYCAPAYAQVDEIVVTARKVEESLQDVPIAVTAFTGDFFRESGLVEFSDIGQLTPNFDVQQDGVSGQGFSNITIRGQTALNRELTSDQAVGITINGAPVTRGTNLFSNLFDIEQIEVLKGPQGTLFGKNTTGGAVVVRTTKPKLNELSGYVEADIGNFGRNDFEGVANVGGETWAIRFGAATQNRDGFSFGVNRAGVADTVGTLTGDEFGDDDEIFYRASALFEPNDKLSIQVNADYHEVEEAGQGTRVLNDGLLFGVFAIALQTPPELGPFAASQQQDASPSLDANETNINATVSYGFEKFTIESITSYRDQELLSINPFAPAAFIEIGQESDIFAQELRVSGEALNDRLKWQFGGFYADEEGIDIDNVGADRTTAAENETIAIFGQGTYAITDRLSFTGGIRYTEEDRALALIVSTTVGEPLVPQQEVSFDGTSWTVGLDYKLTDEILTYGTVSRGFRSGGIDDESISLIVTLPGTTVDDITVDPEFVTNYEIGLKADFFNNTLRWNSAAFYSDYTDIQVQGFDPVLVDAAGQAIITIANSAEAELYGFESELTYVPNDNLSIGGTIGYTIGDFIEFLDEDLATGVVTDRSDEEIGGPELQLSAFARYEDDIFENIRAGAQLNYTYRGEEELLGGAQVALFDDPSQVDLESYGIFNGQIDFDIENIGTNIAFYGRNLFDNNHDTTGFALTAFGLPLAQRAPGAPRTYGVRVRKTF